MSPETDAPEVTTGGQPVPYMAPADRLLWDALGDAKPTFTTFPTPGSSNDLGTARVVARALGTPMTPWQEWAVRVFTEWSPGPQFIGYRYKLVVLTVPRQAGKTTTMRTCLADRALRLPARKSFYTAQTGKDATARWKDLVDQIQRGPLASHVQLRRAIGSQSLTFPNESTISPFAPTPKSLHGYTPHDVMVDEIFALDEVSGNDLMGAIGPAQVTLRDRQLWLVSTMGTKDSTFLHGWVDKGQVEVLNPEATMAYMEWSMAEGLDPYDPDSWSFHPALGHTITKESLSELAATHTFGEWMRAFMNRRTTTTESVIDSESWKALRSDQTPPANTSEISLAYEVAMDRSRSAIMAVWDDPVTGEPTMRELMVRDGWQWLAKAVIELHDDFQPYALGADDGGPTRDVTEIIRKEREDIQLELIGPRDFATACDAFKARAIARPAGFTHDGGSYLAESVANATTRTMGQGWAWDRVKSRGPIPELIAATVALRLHEFAEGPGVAPVFREAS